MCVCVYVRKEENIRIINAIYVFFIIHFIGFDTCSLLLFIRINKKIYVKETQIIDSFSCSNNNNNNNKRSPNHVTS